MTKICQYEKLYAESMDLVSTQNVKNAVLRNKKNTKAHFSCFVIVF